MSDDFTGDHNGHAPVVEPQAVETDIETVVDEQQPNAPTTGETQDTRTSWLAKLLSWVLPQREKHSLQVQALHRAIELHPDGAMNYVLRGELYLQTGDYTQAVDDFVTARTLAETRLESADWGLIDQIVQDRAQRGEEKARRQLST